MWEDDFDVGPAFWSPKQQRLQWTPEQQHPSSVLHVSSAHGLIAIDTCSDVSIGETLSLSNVRGCSPVSLHHLGGTTVLDTCGDVRINDRTLTVFAVSEKELPPGFTMLLGVPDLKHLDVSFDFVRDHPGCSMTDAIQGLEPLDSHKTVYTTLYPLWATLICSTHLVHYRLFIRVS